MGREMQPVILVCTHKETKEKVNLNARYIVSFWEEAYIDKQDVSNDRSTIYLKTVLGEEFIYKRFYDLSASGPKIALEDIGKAIRDSG